ncbi:MAG: glycosyltransferase family 2 protein [Candidatus Bathyarchaeia archaeon]
MNVDVVVCVKDRAKSLDRLLQQIVREIPYKNLIVIYGSSKDETKEVAEKYTNQVFWDGDKGLGAARKLGMEKATSEIVAMIDSDVILTKGWYERLIKYFEDPKVAAVMGTCIYGYGCKPLELYHEYLRLNSQEDWGCHNTLFRRSAVLEVGNFDETIQGAGEDRDLYIRLLNAGYKWIWAKEVVVYHPMSMLEYLRHVRWWAQSSRYGYIKKFFSEVESQSLFRFYCNQIWLILEAFLIGLQFAIKIHPTMIIYFPLIRMTVIMTRLKELKNFLCTHKVQ